MMLSPAPTSNNSTMRPNALLKEPYRYIPALVESANPNSFLFSMTNDGVIQYASDNVLALLGVDAQDIVGRSFDEFISDAPENERVRNRCWEVIPQNAVLTCQCEMLNTNGDVLSAEMRCTGIFEHNELLGLAAFVDSRMKSRDSSQVGSEEKQQERIRVKKLVDQLSGAEREVVDLVVAGHMNKSMAKMLGVAVRTIEARRSRAMAKLQVRSLPDLVKTWLIYSN